MCPLIYNKNHGELDGHGICTIFQVSVFELAFDNVIVEDIIQWHRPNYTKVTKLAFNSLKMIQNDSLSANQTGDDRPLKTLCDNLFKITKVTSRIDVLCDS